KTRFLAVAVEQHDLQLRSRQRQRNAWQTGAAADIQQTASLHPRKDSKTIQQVTAHHLRRLSHGSQIECPIPFDQKLKIGQQPIGQVGLRQTQLVHASQQQRSCLCCHYHALCRSRPCFFRCTSSSETAAGVTPGTRDACPKVSGRCCCRISRSAFDNPSILS